MLSKNLLTIEVNLSYLKQSFDAHSQGVKSINDYLVENFSLLNRNIKETLENAKILEQNLRQVNCDSRDINENLHKLTSFLEEVQKYLHLKK